MKKKISPRRLQRARNWISQQPAANLEAWAQKVTPSLKKAADTLRLDPKDPQQAAILLRVLAQLVFTEGKRGRPKASQIFDTRQYFKPVVLGERYMRAKLENPGMNDRKIAEKLQKQYPDYKNMAAESLRVLLRDAKRALKSDLEGDFGPLPDDVLEGCSISDLRRWRDL
jgi:hypothetical protein